MADLRAWLNQLTDVENLSQGARAVFETAVTSPEKTSYASSHAVAKMAGVNPATVVRAAQGVGFSGWTDFAAELRSQYLSSLTVDRVFDLHSTPTGDPVEQTIGHDIRQLNAMLMGLDAQAVREAAEVVRHSKKTVIFATGTYAAPAIQLSHVGQMMGFEVRIQTGSATAMLNDVMLLQETDCFFTYGVWKTSTIIADLAEVAKSRGTRVVALTDRQSRLKELADVSITVPSEGQGFVPTLTCLISINQAIIRLLSESDRAKTRRDLQALDSLWTSLGIIDPN